MRTFLSVLVATACGVAIARLVRSAPPIPVVQIVSYSIIFLTTILRFFEGNVIYYYKAYADPASNPSGVHMKFDLYLIVVQFSIFTWMASAIGELRGFALAYITLNASDFIWHAICWLQDKADGVMRKASASWCLSNLAMGALLLVGVLVAGPSVFGNVAYENVALIIFALLAFGAAVFDYAYNHDFYTLKDNTKHFLGV